MRKIIYLLLSALWGFALVGCATGGQNQSASDPDINGQLAWMEELNIPEYKFKDQGEIEQAWELNDDLILVKHVWNRDWDYYLFNRNTNEVNWVVPFIENARLEKIADNKLFFLAKGGSDCGNFEFPYRLTYDIGSGELTRSDLYLQRDVVFGTLSWDMVLGKVETKDNSFIVEFNVAEDQVLAGGLRIPLTSVSYNDGRLSMRIYNVTADKTEISNPGSCPVEAINIELIAADVPIDNINLFKKSFPYGGELQGDIDLQVPSVRLDMKLRDKVAYNIDFAMENQEMTIKYIVGFKPIEQAKGNLYELDDEKFQGLSPVEVMELYWQARQQRDLEALRVLLKDGTGVATLEETLLEKAKEWSQGYWMVIDYAVGEYTVNGENASVQVSAKLTSPDGKLVVLENVPYSMTRQDGVWKVNILAAQ